MRKGSAHIRRIMAELDNKGICTSIIRVDTKRYELHINFEVKKTFRKRASANNRIVRIHNKLFPNNQK